MSERPAFSRSDAEIAGLKAAMRAAWNIAGAGYDEIARGLRPAVEHLLDFLPLRPGARLLDVATGTGLAALMAAARGAEVTAIDIAPDLLAEARRQAAKAGLAERIRFEEADAERLPYADASFDVVVSTFGAMFAPRHDAAAYELTRVLRPGGLLGLATWKPEGPNCRLLTLTAPYLPPRTLELPSPLEWGRPEYVAALLGPYVESLEHAEGNAPWRCRSPADALEILFARGLGPTIYVYRQFDDQTKLRVREDAIALLRECLEPDGTVNLRRDYLLTKATRRYSP